MIGSKVVSFCRNYYGKHKKAYIKEDGENGGKRRSFNNQNDILCEKGDQEDGLHAHWMYGVDG